MSSSKFVDGESNDSDFVVKKHIKMDEKRPPVAQKRRASSSPETVSKTVPPSKRTKRSVSQFSERNINNGKVFPLAVLSTSQFQWLHDILASQGWVKLFSQRFEVYPTLVKEFFTHLIFRDTVEGELVAQSSLNGVEIVLSESVLASILEVPYGGFSCYSKDGWVQDFGIGVAPLELAKKYACNESLTSLPAHIEVKRMTPANRVLNMVVRCVLPRGQGRGKVKPLDLAVLELLNSRRVINLPRLFISHLRFVCQSKSHDLPYGMWFTKIFRGLQIPLVHEVSRPITAANEFDKATLSLMHIPIDFDFGVPTGDTAEASNPTAPTTESADIAKALQGIARQLRVTNGLLRENNRTQRRILTALQRFSPPS